MALMVPLGNRDLPRGGASLSALGATSGHPSMVGFIRKTVARLNWLFDDVLALGLLIATFVSANAGQMPTGVDEFLAVRITLKNVLLAVVFMAIWHGCFALFGLYRSERLSLTATALRVVAACTAATFFVSGFTTASSTGAFGFSVVVRFWLIAVAVELVARLAIAIGGKYAEQRVREVKHVLIVGSGPRALQVYHQIQGVHPRRYVVVGFVDSRPAHEIPAEVSARLAGSLEDFESLLSRLPIDQVLIALPIKSQYVAIQQVLDACSRVGVESKYFPNMFAVTGARHAFDGEDELAGVRLHHVADDYRLVVKRIVDVTCSLCGLVALAPVLLGCAIAIKLTSPGPVLFRQDRYGRNRRLFSMYKFRTMVADAEQLQASIESRNEAQGPVFKIRRDPRITPLGRFLRRSSLDELPQLFNVLKGDMSLVGPRPLPVRDVSRFSETWLMRRFSVKPGLTCLWQINGRSNVDFNDWVRLDLDYIDNWSLLLDARILIKTVPVVISGSGAM
jgi:exopolysaccharide biosynthesis polyprenyl glycosylphosphotransferase